jgi:hypothetical protein
MYCDFDPDEDTWCADHSSNSCQGTRTNYATMNDCLQGLNPQGQEPCTLQYGFAALNPGLPSENCPVE